MHERLSSSAGVFHPKLYLLEGERSTIAYVGSSNLTRGGLGLNVEANLRIEGDNSSPPIVEARQAFESYFGHELATELSPEFASRYDELRALRARANTAPYFDESPQWREMDDRGAFPWRVRFVPLGELRAGLSTRDLLLPLRPGAPKNWFHGFIQQSHSLEPADFATLRRAFEAALRAELPATGE